MRGNHGPEENPTKNSDLEGALQMLEKLHTEEAYRGV